MLIVCAVLTFASFLPLVENAGSSKKGIGAAAATLKCDDFRVLNNISWWYDWTQHFQQLTNHCNASNLHAPEFVPMVRVLHSNETAQNIHIPPGSHFVLGYNEPDLVTLNNMTPQEAAMYWPMVEKAAVGIPLVAPVPYKHDFVWLDQFFQHCNGCRIDYVAAHTYFCNANQVMAHLKALYNRYHKKVWLTEFACPHTPDEHVQLGLMRTLLPQLEAADFVYRYSWFEGRIKKDNPTGFVRQSASLLHSNASSLTMIGQFYNSFQPDGHGTSIVG